MSFCVTVAIPTSPTRRQERQGEVLVAAAIGLVGEENSSRVSVTTSPSAKDPYAQVLDSSGAVVGTFYEPACLAAFNCGKGLLPRLDQTSSSPNSQVLALARSLLACQIAPRERKLRSGFQEADVAPGRKVPIAGKRNVLITSALPYVNNVPHLGNIIGCVLSGDAFARYCRLRGYQTLHICGTDEYGTATETKALEEGLSCADLCAKYFTLQRSVYDWFSIAFDHFGRTTNSHQAPIAQDIFLQLHRNGHLLKEKVEQLLCEKCNRFLADRFVEGTCPLCGFADARGDQCDACGKLINAVELIQPRCKVCSSSPTIRSSEHLFLNLTELQPKCAAWLERAMTDGSWSANGVSITQSWLQEGLKPRCITRDLLWGTPVPLPEMRGKVFYVWFDAPIGYISITADLLPNDWKLWWRKNDLDVQLYQFMGKDNVPFHSVVFPCSLLGTDERWTYVHHISTTEYLNYEGGKFSKSRGVGVFGTNVMQSGLENSLWRYYLLANRPEQADTNFGWDDFAAKSNNELLANLGNFASRTCKFIASRYEGRLPASSPTPLDLEFVNRINGELVHYISQMEAVHLKAGLKTAMGISSIGNEYLTACKLDGSLFASNPERCGTVVNVAVNILYLLANLLWPFIPDTADEILAQVNAPLGGIQPTFELSLLPGHCLGEPRLLFHRIEPEKLQQLKAMYSGAAK